MHKSYYAAPIVIISYLPSAVMAQEDGEAEVAAELMRQGFEAYSKEKWGEAILYWKQALVMKPEWSSLRYNIAQAYFRKKDYRSARIVAMEAQQAQPSLKPELARKNDELIAEIDRIEAEQAERKQAELEALRAQKAMADAVRPRASGWIWVGAGALALGGASLAGAAWQADKLEDVRGQMAQPQTRATYDTLADEASGHRVAGNVLLWSSVALALGGAGIILWDLMTPEDVAPSEAGTGVSLGATPTGIFVRLTW